MTISDSKVWEALQEVPDPEIPVISVVELGVVRKVVINAEGHPEVTITPTYSGCPAMKAIEDDIVTHLNKMGMGPVTVHTVLSPAWTTDWITPEARQKLKEYGIAPPVQSSADKGSLLGVNKTIACPLCDSTNTVMTSYFGSTPCKSLYKCETCKEPFDYFKCL